MHPDPPYSALPPHREHALRQLDEAIRGAPTWKQAAQQRHNHRTRRRRVRNRARRASTPLPLWSRVITALEEWSLEEIEALLPWLDNTLLQHTEGFCRGRLETRLAQWAAPVHQRTLPSLWADRLARGEPVPQARLARVMGLRPLDHSGTPFRSAEGWRRLLQAPELDGIEEVHVDQSLRGPWLEIACAEARLKGVRVVYADQLYDYSRSGRVDWLLQAPWAQSLDMLDLSESIDSSLGPLLDNPTIRIGHLMVEECWISDEAMRGLLDWPPLARMQCLNIRFNCLHPERFQQELRQSTVLHPGLTVLGLELSADLPCTTHPDLLPSWRRPHP